MLADCIEGGGKSIVVSQSGKSKKGGRKVWLKTDSSMLNGTNNIFFDFFN